MDVADIHQQPYNNGGYLLFIEGCPTAFTDIVELAGSGASSYIGTSYGQRGVLLGLTVPDLPLGETSPIGARFDEVRVTFRIRDFDGSVASLFRQRFPDLTSDSMGERLAPTDDPAPANIAGPNQTAVQLWDRHLGIEAIGPAGERRHYWIEPGTAPPGLDHFGGAHWPPSVITDSPYVWAGRMVAVYRIVQDPDTGDWPSWADQHSGGSLWWIGKLKDRGTFAGGRAGREFHLPAVGVSSLLRKNLNLARPPRWIAPSEVGLSLSGDALKLAAWIGQEEPPWVPDGLFMIPSTFECQTLESTNTFAGCVTREDYAEVLRDVVYTMISGANTGSVLATTNANYTGPNPPADEGDHWQADDDSRDVYISPDGTVIKIKCELKPYTAGINDGTADRNYFGFYLGLAIDRRIVQFLGWDPISIEWGEPASGQRCPVGGTLWGESEGDDILPDKHIIGHFATRSDQFKDHADPAILWSNGGHYHEYFAPWQEGTITLSPAGGEVLSLGIGELPCEGQLAQPWTYGSQINSTDVDSTGWWVFRGLRLTAEEYESGADPTEFIQIALCEWIASTSGDAIAEDSTTHARIKIIRWEDPRRFGLDFDRIDEEWTLAAGGGLEVAPLAVFGGIHPSAPDWRHRVALRLLLSSGTGSWIDNLGELEISPGDNHPADLPAVDPWGGDVERADMGLGIPRAWVDWLSFYVCAAKLPGGAGGALNRVSYAALGPVQAEDVLRQLMTGGGWAWSWKRTAGEGPPQFGCWDPIEPLSAEDVEVTITRGHSAETSSPLSDLADKWGAVIEIRNEGPFDRFAWRVDSSPLESGYEYEQTAEAQWAGRRYSDGKIVWPIEDGGLRNPSPWLGTADVDLYQWTELARERFAFGFGRYYGQPSRVYRDILDATFITRIGLGSIVRVTNTTVEAPDGTIGIDHVGRVIDATIINPTRHANGRESDGMQALRVAVLLQPDPIDSSRVWGPSAMAGVDSWDADTNTLTISEDWAGVGNGHNDTTGFTQPAWDGNTAGSLRITIRQSENGLDWDVIAAASADVASADANALTLSLTNTTGTIYRDTIKRITAAPRDEQTAAWALAIYSHVVDPSGQFDSAQGFRL